VLNFSQTSNKELALFLLLN